MGPSVTHGRWQRKYACGQKGPSTEEPDLITCSACRVIAMDAENMARECGCRRPWIHVGVARARHELRDHNR